MRPVTLRSRLVPLVVITLLVSVARAAGAAPAETRKERVEEVWLDAKGESGHVRTAPMYLDDAPGEYHFGPKFCGRSHRLGVQTLSVLQGALASGQPVRIDAQAHASAGTTRQCVTGVAVFAPLP